MLTAYMLRPMNLEIDKKWLIGGGIGAATLIVFAIVAWQVKSIDIPVISEGKSAAETPASEAEINELSNEFEEEEGEALETCLILWNGEGNAAARQTLAVMEASYASATFSAIYPDRCLVTAANPKWDLAAQFLEGELEGEAGEMFVSFSQLDGGSASTLDPSVTNWNLVVASEGQLWLKSEMEDPEF